MNNYSGATNILELKNVNQVYKKKDGSDFVLFNNLNLAIEDFQGKGQFVALMGESGCGKSTILQYFTGLQKPTSGEIQIAGRPLKPTDTIPMVFQFPSSLQWYTVLDNVALPLRLKGIKREDAREQAMAMIKIVGLEGHEGKFAKSPGLSGGQLQRVAIARSLVANPAMIMMDEPFSALDSVNRRKMQEFLMELFTRSEVADLNPTVVLVTHDAREAVYVANDIVVMSANPSGIKAVIKVNLGPRSNPIRRTTQYLDIVTYLETLI